MNATSLVPCTAALHSSFWLQPVRRSASPTVKGAQRALRTPGRLHLRRSQFRLEWRNKPPKAVSKLSRKEIEAWDRERIGRIILAQIAQTPERIAETWLVDVCQHISGPPSLEELMLEALEEGKKFDVQLPGGGQEPDSAHRPEVLHQ